MVPSSHRLVLADRRAALYWVGLSGTCLFVVVVSALPPFVGPAGSAAIRAAFASACHQLPERSFSAGGVPFALCHRCWGIVSGLSLGALLVGPVYRLQIGLRKVGVPALIVSGAALGMEWVLSAAQIHDGSSASRALTGGAMGFVTACFLADAIFDWAGFRKPPSTTSLTSVAPHGGASPISS